ncbi:MAG TPA: hypothetical protein PLS10_07135 [Chitinophagales bacterium]|nr:hypothetical protein [Chitinophagales bacterium]
MQNRFILQASEVKNHFVCTDQENKIVIIFEKGKFNDSQKVEFLEDFNGADFMNVAKYMREIGDWLAEYHYEKLF